MFFRQIYEDGLAQASYFFGCPAAGEAMVIDPRRDIDVYLQLAQETKLNIVAVGETHIHADFLSGARELAHATGATLYLSDEGDENWKYRGLEGFEARLLKDGDEWLIGNIRVRAVHTPGHTPEHITFLIYDGKDAPDPMIAITGDFIFVGDLGRSDLLEEAAGIQGTAEPGARSSTRASCASSSSPTTCKSGLGTAQVRRVARRSARCLPPRSATRNGTLGGRAPSPPTTRSSS
jgi:hydroxyacylglutathione hydrolase